MHDEQCTMQSHPPPSLRAEENGVSAETPQRRGRCFSTSPPCRAPLLSGEAFEGTPTPTQRLQTVAIVGDDVLYVPKT